MAASDPALEVCPGYDSNVHEPLRVALMHRFALTEEQAIVRLTDIWTADRTQRAEAWNRQRVEQQQAEELALREQREEEEEQRRLEEQEAEQERKDAEKKKPKINDFDSALASPSVIVPRPSQYAIQKLASFEFVEMWYFSPEGCAEAACNHRSQADDAFGLAASNDILTIRPVASVKASKNARPNYELTFSEFLQGKNSYLHHIKQSSWPDKHINALAEFFWNLENHPARSNPNGDAVALQYAARIRRQWHDDLKNNTGKAFNIAIINENLMNSMMFEVNASIQTKVMRKVSIPAALIRPPTHAFPLSHPLLSPPRRFSPHPPLLPRRRGPLIPPHHAGAMTHRTCSPPPAGPCAAAAPAP